MYWAAMLDVTNCNKTCELCREQLTPLPSSHERESVPSVSSSEVVCEAAMVTGGFLFPACVCVTDAISTLRSQGHLG